MSNLRIVGYLIIALGFGYVEAPAAADEPAKRAEYWVDGQGMTLYTSENDAPGKSNCNHQCALDWPPLLVKDDGAASGDWSIVVRDDSSKMWAYKGQPLYTFVGDKNPGQITGDGDSGFHLARP